MNKQISAAIIVAAIVGAPIAVFAQTAYLPSSNGWAGEAQVAAPANVPSASPFDGPRPSSHNNWPGMSQQFVPAFGSSTDPVLEGPRPSGH
jgi:hypothetical protein